MDCSSHGLSTNGTTGNWRQAGCNGSCILQKVTLASMVGKYEIQAKMTWAVMVGKYQIHAKIALASMVGSIKQAKMYRPGTGAAWGRKVRGRYVPNGTVVRGKRYGGGTGAAPIGKGL